MLYYTNSSLSVDSFSYACSFEMPLYTKPTNKDIETIRTIEKKSEFVTEEIIEEIEFKNNHIPKSQILNSK